MLVTRVMLLIDVTRFLLETVVICHQNRMDGVLFLIYAYQNLSMIKCFIFFWKMTQHFPIALMEELMQLNVTVTGYSKGCSKPQH